VIARSIAFRHKGAEPREAGQSLGVSSVVLGLIDRRAEQLILSAELIDVTDGSRIWGAHYQRPYTDTLSVQEEIAWEISERIRLRLSGEPYENVNAPWHY